MGLKPLGTESVDGVEYSVLYAFEAPSCGCVGNGWAGGEVDSERFVSVWDPVVYPSQSRRDFWQLKQIGLASSHLILRFRQVMHPVFVRRLI